MFNEASVYGSVQQQCWNHSPIIHFHKTQQKKMFSEGKYRLALPSSHFSDICNVASLESILVQTSKMWANGRPAAISSTFMSMHE